MAKVELRGRALADIIAPPPGDLFSETNDNSVAILHTYSTARVLFTGNPEEGVRGERPLREALNSHQRSETTHLVLTRWLQ
jgi:hypothetical protein